MNLPAPPSHSLVDTPAVVLDTNVLLDWLVFDDPHAVPWVKALTTGQLRWLATPCMREELQRVLDYEAIAARLADRQAIDTAWARFASVTEPAPRAPMRCADPDDQVFIDLAVAHRAKWLLTKDRELLRLAKSALPWGVRVQPPHRWAETRDSDLA